MLIKVWEVYEHNSPRCIAYLTKELADKQDVFSSVDIVKEATLDLCQEDADTLNKGLPLW